MNNKINEKLSEIETENFIWIIYIGIIILSFYSNFLEKKYFLFNDTICKNKYRKIMIFIFSILIIVYYYFLSEAYKSFKSADPLDDKKKNNLITLSLIGSSLIFMSGLIFLYIAVKDEDLNVEIAFN